MIEKNAKLILIIGYIITRIQFLVTPVLLNDVVLYYMPYVNQILQGGNPFLTDISTIVYPPFGIILTVVQVFLFGDSSFALKLVQIEFDFAIILLLYKVSPYFFKKKDQQWNLTIFYAFFPITLLNLLFGLGTWATIFFVIAAIYLHLKGKSFWCGVFASLGFLIELYPICFAYLVAIVLLAKREIRKFLSLISGFIIIYLLINLPWYGFDFVKMLAIPLLHLQRKSTLIPIFKFGPDIMIQITPDFAINLFAIFPVVMIGIYGILLYIHVRNHTNLTTIEEFNWYLLFFLIFPITFLNINYRYFFWATPFLFLFISINLENWRPRKFILIIVSSLIPIVILLDIIFPQYIFGSVSTYPVSSNYVPLFYYMLVSSIWVISFILFWLREWKHNFNKKPIFYTLFQRILIIMIIFQIEYIFVRLYSANLVEMPKLLLDVVIFIGSISGILLLLQSIVKYYGFFEIMRKRMSANFTDLIDN